MRCSTRGDALNAQRRFRPSDQGIVETGAAAKAKGCPGRWRRRRPRSIGARGAQPRSTSPGREGNRRGRAASRAPRRAPRSQKAPDGLVPRSRRRQKPKVPALGKRHRRPPKKIWQPAPAKSAAAGRRRRFPAARRLCYLFEADADAFLLSSNSWMSTCAASSKSRRNSQKRALLGWRRRRGSVAVALC